MSVAVFGVCLRNFEALVLIRYSSRTGREPRGPYHKRQSSAAKVDVAAGAVVGAVTPDRRLVNGSEMTATATMTATIPLIPIAVEHRGEGDTATAAIPTTDDSVFC